MRLSTVRRSRQPPGLPGVTGVARLDRRTKDLTKRLTPGDIAIIDHVDIDRVSAEALVAAGAAAVVNVSPSISGRYPNLGPEILLTAGVMLVDAVDEQIWELVHEGDEIRVFEGEVFREDEVIAKGVEQTVDVVVAEMAEARAGMATQLEAFAANTMEYIRRERDLLFDGIGVPEIETILEKRHVLIVVRGYHYKTDLQALRPYIREYRPILIGVDGGGDALLEEGYRPDLIVGDMDSVSERALRQAKEIVVHAYPDGHAPGLARIEDLGLHGVLFPAAGTSEDVAMLLADEKGASLIVAVGTHATLVEFLDKGRAGMASTFLTRLRVGSKLVDAKGVSRLYRSRINSWSLLLLFFGALIAMIAAVSISPAGQIYGKLVVDAWHDFTHWVGGLGS
jgi:uncharacterized membrane-anchored protein